MKALRHIAVGFLVSFIGSVPLGYLNVVGLEIYKNGLAPTAWYLLGVVSIEIFVIYFTLIFVNMLMRRKKLMRFIEGFTPLFLFALALIFYLNSASGPNGDESRIAIPRGYSYYLIGVGLSCINFMQIPFWTGWNLFLLNKNYVSAAGSNKYFFVAGTAFGTFFGMLAFILSINKLALMFFTGSIMQLVAMVFLVMAIFSTWKYYRKYHAAKK